MYSRRLDAESNRRIEYFFYVSWFAYLLFIPGFSAITGLLPHTNPRLDLLLDTLARLRPVFGVVACLATVVVGMHDLVAFRRGENISLWKYSFMASTCGTFLILAQAVQTNFLLYLFLAEIIHGAQYFLVTWANGIRTPPLRQTWFMRWMPTSSLMRLVLVLVIVALCVPNGSLVGLGLSHVPGIQLLRIGTTISLLHYYFDGFAWKTPPQKIGRGLFEIIDFLRQTGVVFAVFAATWAFDWAFL